MQPADTEEKFDEVKKIESQNTYTFLEPPVNDLIYLNPATGYQPFEYITGSRGSKADEAEVFRRKGKVGFTRPSIFGHCSQDYNLKFMENLETAECVSTKSIVNAAVCKSMGFSNVGYLTLQSGSGSEVVTPTVGTQLKFSSDTKKQIPIDKTTEFLKVVSSGNCGCDNYVLETHYKVFFAPSEIANQFTITKVVADVVYGSLADGNCLPLVLT